MTSALQPVQSFLSRNQRRLALAVLLLVCIYFLVIFGEQAWRANRLEAELAQQRASIADIRRENEELAGRAELMNSPAYSSYVEQIARRDLALARPGETVVIVPRQSADPVPETVPEPVQRTTRQNWQLWIDAIFDQDES
ncbi:MAG: septum formation initiator family protein [Thermomicrobiales bacterium]